MRTFAFKVRRIHHQAEKFKWFRSNNVNLIITTCFFTRKLNRIRHEPFSIRTKETATETTKMVFWTQTTFQDVKHFCDKCLPCCIVLVQSRPCEWHISTFASVLHHLEIWKRVLLSHYRSCPCNEAHSICPALLTYHLENSSLCWTCWRISMMCLQNILRIDSNF